MNLFYEAPECRVILLMTEDILTSSPNSDAGNDELPIIPIGKPDSV